jgi:hypothetical protein
MWNGASGCSIHLSACATAPGAASGTMWLGTSMPALPNEHPSRVAPLRSTTVTRQPRSTQ